LAFPQAAGAVTPAPQASFTVSPESPLTLEPVTFTSTSTGEITGIAWNLDNDGSFDDGVGQTASLTFPVASVYTVQLRAVGPGGKAETTQYIPVGDRPPTPSIAYFPASPQAGDPIQFVALGQDPDGRIVSQQWDLDGDNSFEAAGPMVTRTFPAAGTYTVRLRAVDDDGSSAVATQSVRVDPKPPVFLRPFPIVRVSGKVNGAGAKIKRLVVEAPPGALVKIRCHGAGCPLRKQTRRVIARPGPHALGPRQLRFRRFERLLRPRAVLEVFVTKPGTIGKYMRLEIRPGKRPRRQDLCVFPDAKHPKRCEG
jgi:PKD repeat protein